MSRFRASGDSASRSGHGGEDEPVRVLVVEDSATARYFLARVIDADPRLQVVGFAQDGREALSEVERLRPDVVSMDIHMPGLDGLEATRQLMQTNPVPIVIVCSSSTGGDVDVSFKALEAGALAVVQKPAGASDLRHDEQVAELVRTLRLMADVRVVRRRRPRVTPRLEVRPRAPLEIVAMAASTGGPQALVDILERLPPDLPVPIVIVQHIASGFDEGLVQWLARISRLPVSLATQGSRLQAGTILVAPHGAHLEVSRDGVVSLVEPEAGDGYVPSATRLFRAVAKAYGPRALAVILTGMGSDGVEGLLDVRAAGGLVLAQDESSSVVFGMPRVAVERGAVDRVVPLEALPDAIVRAVREPRRPS